MGSIGEICQLCVILASLTPVMTSVSMLEMGGEEEEKVQMNWLLTIRIRGSDGT